MTTGPVILAGLRSPLAAPQPEILSSGSQVLVDENTALHLMLQQGSVKLHLAPRKPQEGSAEPA